ncbi:PIG-L family deacetylase [Solitalea koreensis]|uniref:GlcNAc-PI de-N-acetylase n=1 Tax=Solitalea koreensis TaxID=543615 RepID=A0A521BQU8_9SPHI|nr:PIG-L family deacetylase [Solitalea koreensis]SMO49537.1 GlcNAc-PI de-N-acetylase [Solitalea koreensis]
MKKIIQIALALLVVVQFSQAQTPKSYSSSDILLGLKKLNTVGSVLYIAAHPDDENTRLIAYLANERCLRTGYLALTRGDGGQNLIGNEQGDLLGLIRTQELLAARRVDGGEQFFTRANDFGFSKNPEETFSIWNRDSILADVVWTIRKFRPDVLLTRFATDGSGGHGHHTASAILAEEAFTAAADPTRYPEQLKYVRVWQAKRLLYNNAARFWNPNADMSGNLSLEVGSENFLLGKSYGEIAAESRSNHKSQGFGSARVRGSILEYFKPIKGDVPQKDIFEGIDQSFSRIKGAEKFSKLAQQVYKEYKPEQPSASLPLLLEAYQELGSIKDSYWHAEKKKQLEELIAACAGLWLEANPADFETAQGADLLLTINALNRSKVPVTLEKIILPNGSEESPSKLLEKDVSYKLEKAINIPSDAKVTNPYWLADKHAIGMFNVTNQQLIGKPENDAALQVKYLLNFGKISIEFTRPVIYKAVDPVDGEVYRPFVITPPVMVTLNEKAYVFPDNSPKKVQVIVKSGVANCTGTVKLKLPEGWNVEPISSGFNLKAKDEEQTLEFMVTPSGGSSQGILKAVAMMDGKEYSQGLTTIIYKHIPVQTLFPYAEARLSHFNLIRKSKLIGYIVGAGDDIPQSLIQIGYDVKFLTDDMLSNGIDLSSFNAIIVGVRAYNTNDRMKFYYDKLMNYVKNGGNLIVQYNTNNFLGGVKSPIGPYPFTISRDRVTDENAEIRFELPQHPVLNSPNKITADDFKGWIQERGIYFAGDWDANYQTPLSMNDPNEKSSKGSTLITQYGKGYFVYTGVVFFRELPAGVPGAYRLFVNMIELGK